MLNHSRSPRNQGDCAFNGEPDMSSSARHESFVVSVNGLMTHPDCLPLGLHVRGGRRGVGALGDCGVPQDRRDRLHPTRSHFQCNRECNESRGSTRALWLQRFESVARWFATRRLPVRSRSSPINLECEFNLRHTATSVSFRSGFVFPPTILLGLGTPFPDRELIPTEAGPKPGTSRVRSF